MEFETITYTNKGGRRYNEDFVGYLDEPKRKAWVVADGLGGHNGSKMASHIAGEAMLDTYKTCEDIQEKTVQASIEGANQLILEAQRQDEVDQKIRTTIVTAASDGEKIYMGSVGSSRLYYFRNGKIVYVTPDAEIWHYKEQSKLLGADKKYKIDEKTIDLQVGDAFLLCSDGFWKQIDEMEMLIDLNKSQTAKAWVKHLLIRFISRASGKYDNYTVCGVFVK